MILFYDKTDTDYNFTVDEFHTYHIGELGVWVHNTCYRFIGELDRRAAELLVTRRRSNEWKDAVAWAKGADFLKKGARFQVRVSTKSEAEQLLKDMMGNMNRYKVDARDTNKYNKGYEVHQRSANGNNNLYHIKWYKGNATGHIFYEVPH